MLNLMFTEHRVQNRRPVQTPQEAAVYAVPNISVPRTLQVPIPQEYAVPQTRSKKTLSSWLKLGRRNEAADDGNLGRDVYASPVQYRPAAMETVGRCSRLDPWLMETSPCQFSTEMVHHYGTVRPASGVPRRASVQRLFEPPRPESLAPPPAAVWQPFVHPLPSCSCRRTLMDTVRGRKKLCRLCSQGNLTVRMVKARSRGQLASVEYHDPRLLMHRSRLAASEADLYGRMADYGYDKMDPRIASRAQSGERRRSRSPSSGTYNVANSHLSNRLKKGYSDGFESIYQTSPGKKTLSSEIESPSENLDRNYIIQSTGQRRRPVAVEVACPVTPDVIPRPKLMTSFCPDPDIARRKMTAETSKQGSEWEPPSEDEWSAEERSEKFEPKSIDKSAKNYNGLSMCVGVPGSRLAKLSNAATTSPSKSGTIYGIQDTSKVTAKENAGPSKSVIPEPPPLPPASGLAPPPPPPPLPLPHTGNQLRASDAVEDEIPLKPPRRKKNHQELPASADKDSPHRSSSTPCRPPVVSISDILHVKSILKKTQSPDASSETDSDCYSTTMQQARQLRRKKVHFRSHESLLEENINKVDNQRDIVKVITDAYDRVNRSQFDSSEGGMDHPDRDEKPAPAVEVPVGTTCDPSSEPMVPEETAAVCEEKEEEQVYSGEVSVSGSTVAIEIGENGVWSTRNVNISMPVSDLSSSPPSPSSKALLFNDTTRIHMPVPRISVHDVFQSNGRGKITKSNSFKTQTARPSVPPPPPPVPQPLTPPAAQPPAETAGPPDVEKRCSMSSFRADAPLHVVSPYSAAEFQHRRSLPAAARPRLTPLRPVPIPQVPSCAPELPTSQLQRLTSPTASRSSLCSNEDPAPPPLPTSPPPRLPTCERSSPVLTSPTFARRLSLSESISAALSISLQPESIQTPLSTRSPPPLPPSSSPPLPTSSPPPLPTSYPPPLPTSSPPPLVEPESCPYVPAETRLQRVIDSITTDQQLHLPAASSTSSCRRRSQRSSLAALGQLLDRCEVEPSRYCSVSSMVQLDDQDHIYEEIPERRGSRLHTLLRASPQQQRSFFRGASRSQILSYLQGARDRTEHHEPDPDLASVRGAIRGDASDESLSSISSSSKSDRCSFAEVERNDSGVGSESSKSSVRSEQLGTHDCVDCSQLVETQVTSSGVLFDPLTCSPCSKKRLERKGIITEIVETELKYGRDLRVILEEFYRPMLVAALLTHDQLSQIFLNVEELLEVSRQLTCRLKASLEQALSIGDEDLVTVSIGHVFLDNLHNTLQSFETYCTKQGAASLLLTNLEKEKDLLRVFLKVSQMENTLLRRMNLSSFLMVPIQRVTKYPLLLSRLRNVTPVNHHSCSTLLEAQQKIELHLEHMNATAKDSGGSRIWRRISMIGASSSSPIKRSVSEQDITTLRLRKFCIDTLGWSGDECCMMLEARLLFTVPAEGGWTRRGRSAVRMTPVHGLLVTRGRPDPDLTRQLGQQTVPLLPGPGTLKQAALLLVKDKGTAGRLTLIREALLLSKCIVCSDQEVEDCFEVHDCITKDSLIIRCEDGERTRTWFHHLQSLSQRLGAWRKRRNALANIMMGQM